MHYGNVQALREGAESPPHPTKTIRIADKEFTISGLAADDPYFAGLSQDYDLDFIRICRSFIGPDFTCVDVGANIGLTALALSQFVPAGEVIAVEGSPSVAALLKRNVDNSCQRNVRVAHCAVAEFDGKANFNDNSAFGRISATGVSVPAKRLTTILSDHNAMRLDFLKVDVEGTEWAILKDALPIINQYKTLILFEFNSFCQLVDVNSNPWEFAQWITAQFEHIYLVRRGGPVFLKRIAAGIEGARDILLANITADNSVSDILATNAPERLVGRLMDLESELNSLRQGRPTGEELAARLMVEQMRLSTSWRITAPVRWLRGCFRSRSC
jgi:FkbM family methyltransferase